MKERGRVPLLFVACSLALLMAGACSGDDDGCGALCRHTVTFRYAEPRAGQAFEITFAPQGATIECELATTGEATCQPNVGGFHLEFGRDGLRSVTWPDPPEGEIEVKVTIDGALVSDARFDYQRSALGDACGGGCGEEPMFDLE
jgi:hypothetical protein